MGLANLYVLYGVINIYLDIRMVFI